MGTVSPSQSNPGEEINAADINTPVNQLAAVVNGNIENVNIKSDAAISGSKLADNSIDVTAKASTWDGWIKVTDSWAYASATTVTVPTDATTKYSVGDFVKFDQSGTKYFRVSVVAATTLTLTGISAVTVANAAITNIYYSKVQTPQNVPVAGVDWGQELGRATLTGAGDTISITPIAARKYLLVRASLLATGGTITSDLRFNNDTGNNYTTRASLNGAADGTATSASSIGTAGTAGAFPKLVTFNVVNITAQEKLVEGVCVEQNTAGAANSPNKNEFVGKWANTAAQITRVDIINSGSGDFAIGSEVVVLGHD